MATHPYDLAAWVVAAEAGVVIEELHGGPLDAPLDTSTPVAWAAYANEEIASQLRPRIQVQRG
jgi:fructose-1,6-bisphosphatase/inositol monophosphatase family enzyme